MFGKKTATATGTRGQRQNPVRSGDPKVKEAAPPVTDLGDEEEDGYEALRGPRLHKQARPRRVGGDEQSRNITDE